MSSQQLEEFSLGDVVRLNGDGPRMIIHEVLDDGRIVCVWSENGEERRDVFIPATIKQPDDGRHREEFRDSRESAE